MRVTLHSDDGSSETRDVARLVFHLADWHLEATPSGDPLMIRLYVPGTPTGYGNFVVHHGCANSMSVQLEPHADERAGDEAG